MWSQEFSVKIYSNWETCLLILSLPILMGSILNYNYNSAITNKNSNHCNRSCFPKATFYGCWFFSHTQWSESIRWKGQDEINWSFFHNKCNLKLMNYRAIILQIMKIPVMDTRLSTGLGGLLRATFPCMGNRLNTKLWIWMQQSSIDTCNQCRNIIYHIYTIKDISKDIL